MIEKLLTQWLDYNFGNGEEHQFRFYRCYGCHGLVTHKMIQRGGCPCGIDNRVKPAVLSFKDKFSALVLPFTINRYWPPEVMDANDDHYTKL